MKKNTKTKSQLLEDIKLLKKKNKHLEKLIDKKGWALEFNNYKRIFDQTSIPISLINKNGKTEFVNKAFTKIFGYTLKDIPDSESWLKKTYPEKTYRNKVRLSWKKNVQSSKSIRIPETVFHVTCKSGTVKETIFHLSKIDDNRLLLLVDDITKELKIERVLKENEEIFRTISDQALFGISIFKEDKYVYMNNEFANSIGYPQKELLEMNPDEIENLIHPDDKENVIIRVKQIMQNKNDTDKKNIVRFIAKNGSIKTVQGWSKLISLKGEKALLTTLLDITEKVEAEKALIESKERFKGLFENATVGIYRTTPSGEILMANPALIKMLGYKSIDEISKTNVVKKGYINLEDRIYFQRILDKFGEIKGFESEWWKKDNSRINVRESATAIKNSSGKVLYYEGTVEDITDQKKAEKELLKNELKYKTLFDLSPSGIMLSDFKGTIIAANPAFCNSLGYQPEEIIGKGIKTIASPESRNEIKKHLKLLHEGKTLRHIVRNVTKDGNYRYMDLHETKIPLNETEYGILSASNDITERKKFEEELIIAKEKAENSDRLKTEFLAQISHEIRTPINSILSFTSYLQDELRDSEVDEINNIFDIIHKAGTRMTRTIDMLLNMSELQTGSYEPSPKEIDLYDNVIKTISSGFQRHALTKKIKFTTVKKTDDTITVGDEYTLNQIFDNLINNAFKYTPSGQIKVTVGRTRKNKLYAQVSDTGIGISDEFISMLFEPFSQEEQGYTRKFEGNGLGLALVKKYCELNNADISVKSKKGAGSAFTVTFN